MLRTLFKQNLTHGRHILKRTLYPSIYNSRYLSNITGGYQKDCIRDVSGLPIESLDEYKQRINKDTDETNINDNININKYVAKNILNDSKLIALFGTSAMGYNMIFTSLGDAGYVVGPYVLGSAFISHLFGRYVYSLLKDNYVANNNDDIENNTYRYIIAGSYGAALSPLIFCNPETLNLCTLVGLSYISASVSSNYFLNRNTSIISRGTYPLHLAGWTSIIGYLGYKYGNFHIESLFFSLPIIHFMLGYIDNRRLINGFYTNSIPEKTYGSAISAFAIGFYTLNPEYFESVYTFLNNIYTSA